MDTETQSAQIKKACDVVGSQINLAKLIGVTPPAISQWSNGLRPVPIEKIVLIEQVTSGAVTRKDLRPNDWHLIWPELAENDQQAKDAA